MNRNKLIKIVFICVALILMLVIVYSGLRILESTVFLKQQDKGPVESKWIVRDGVRYYPRQDIVVVMLLGIDREGKLEDLETTGGYAADMITLLVFDEQTQESRLLCLNRDTMATMTGLNEHGLPESKYFTQLAVSHTFGSGLEDSCENTRDAVSDFLYGINIDHYVSVNMDAINIMNDLVGGVSVTVRDDFSQIDPSITMGEITLQGQQAMNFVRSRRGLGDQLNLSRMERQREYMNGFMEALRAKLEQSDTFALSAYEKISPYVVTDCSANTLSGLMERYADYPVVEIVSPEGENVLDNGHYEFYADEENLDELILRFFYAPKT